VTRPPAPPGSERPTSVVNICDLLERAAALLTLEDGCCHQIHDTGRWRDSRLIGGWLTDLATNLSQRSTTALDDAQSDPETSRDLSET
jgi:hypothetical protein